MSTITSLSIWKDIGFTEGCVEVPSKTSSLPPLFVTYRNLNPARDRMFTEVQVKGAYEDLYDCSYLKAVYDMNNGSDVTVYGWIDSVECSSDTAGSPMTRIRWHVDLWRTYLPNASFGSGIVKRRPLVENGSVPPQQYPYRYTKFVTRYDVMVPQEYWCVLINFNGTNATTQTTSTYWGCWCVSNTSPSTGYKVSGGSAVAPSLNETLSGRFDEALGLDPESINSIFLSPVFPRTYTDAQSLSMTGWSVNPNIAKGNILIATGKSSFGLGYSRSLVTEGSPALPAESWTDDKVSYVLCDMQGYALGTMPWGMKFSWTKFWLVSSTEACYIRFALLESETQTLQSAVAEGRVFTSPCINIGLSSNATSSYVYSGARETEREQRRLTTEQTRDLGIAGTANSALQGGISGALMGIAGGPLGILAGAGIGAITSAAGNALSTASTYKVSTRYDDEFMKLSDYSHANQTSINMLPSGSFDPLNNGIQGYYLVKMVKDEYSIAQRDADIANYGVNVEEPMTSCAVLVNLGGPLQISNLTVTGQIPNEAKHYIRERFAKGVVLK